jgi:hypothetical protein
VLGSFQSFLEECALPIGHIQVSKSDGTQTLKRQRDAVFATNLSGR